MNSRLQLVALALVGTLSTSVAALEPTPSPLLRAQLSCQHTAGPGRLLCELHTQAQSGKLVWTDALVVRAPTFARPLRSRFVVQLDSAGAPSASAKLALVAAGAGEGKLELLVRAVVCHAGPNGEWCAPEVLPVSAVVAVGAVDAPISDAREFGRF